MNKNEQKGYIWAILEWHDTMPSLGVPKYTMPPKN
jgi:hypothetical protein